MVHGDPAQIYADTPDKVAPVEHTALGAALLKSVQSSGFASDEYVPKPRELPEREDTPLWKPVTKDQPFVAIDVITSPLKNPLTEKVASSAYGISSPPVVQRPDPKPLEPRFDTSTTHSTMLSIEELTFAPTTLPNSREEEDYSEDESNVMGGQYSKKPPPPVAPKPHNDYDGTISSSDDDEEKVTIMPL